MPSIALVGPDGAGKTTVTRLLEQSRVLRLKYLYMGINTSSSNIALPTSRLAECLKTRARQTVIPRHGVSHGSGDQAPGARRPRGVVWTAARLANRLAEQWFRQFVAWSYQARGYTVIYDRHFVLDFGATAPGQALPVDQRIYRWCLAHLYPRPDLVIMLDAPGHVLFARKGESTIEKLESRRQLLLDQGARLPGFLRVDATRPLEVVCEEVAQHIVTFCEDPAGFSDRRRTNRGSATLETTLRHGGPPLNSSPSCRAPDA